MESMECQYNNQCGGWCKAEEERERGLCDDCLEAEREEDEERRRVIELRKAVQRIACAAGIELAQPGEIADIVCARLKAPTQGDDWDDVLNVELTGGVPGGNNEETLPDRRPVERRAGGER